MNKICECGCKGIIIYKRHHKYFPSKFILGHNLKIERSITSFTRGHIPWNKGLNKKNNKIIKKVAEGKLILREYRTCKCGFCKKKFRCKINSKKQFISGHNGYIHGKSKEPYSIEWTEKLKKKIRKRDKYLCQLCGIQEMEYNKKLHVHHIDYNKKNNKTNNLISLCKPCHMKTNTNREYWLKKFHYLGAL